MSIAPPVRAGGLNRPPIVLVPACLRVLGDLPFLVAGRKYVDAVRLAGAVPLVVPAAQVDELGTLLDVADGLLLTGSPSNVHPSHFGEDVHDPSLPLDPDRDAWTLPLIREALARGIPLMGICRGFQEVNVALGGSLLLMFVIGFGITMDVEDLSYAVLDRDQTTLSQSYTLNLAGSRYFTEHPPIVDYEDLDRRV